MCVVLVFVVNGLIFSGNWYLVVACCLLSVVCVVHCVLFGV